MTPAMDNAYDAIVVNNNAKYLHKTNILTY